MFAREGDQARDHCGRMCLHECEMRAATDFMYHDSVLSFFTLLTAALGEACRSSETTPMAQAGDTACRRCCARARAQVLAVPCPLPYSAIGETACANLQMRCARYTYSTSMRTFT